MLAAIRKKTNCNRGWQKIKGAEKGCCDGLRLRQLQQKIAYADCAVPSNRPTRSRLRGAISMLNAQKQGQRGWASKKQEVQQSKP